MNVLKSILGVSAIFLMSSPLLTLAADAWQDPISKADWRVNAKPSVVERNFTKKQVAQFVDNWRGVYGETDAELAEPPSKAEQVGDFKWFDIDNDGVYELFLTFAETRAIFGGPSIYKVVNGKKTDLQHLGGNIAKIDEVMEDLDGDGRPELLLPRSVSGYPFGLAFPRPIWTSIYRWNGQKFEDASARFRDFYLKRQLPKAEARIKEIASRAVENPALAEDEFYQLELASAYYVRDKILRFTGQDPRAGIDRAREWAKSPNPNLRHLAVDLFKDAGASAYAADIKLLASDPDPSVASHAKRE